MTVHLHSVYESCIHDALSVHSSVEHGLSHSYHHHPENYKQFPVGPTYQPTYHQPSHPGYYPPPGHPQHVCHYGHSRPPQLPPTNSPHHTSFPPYQHTPYQYTGAQVQQPGYQGNICCSTFVLRCWESIEMHCVQDCAWWSLIALRMNIYTQLRSPCMPESVTSPCYITTVFLLLPLTHPRP